MVLDAPQVELQTDPNQRQPDETKTAFRKRMKAAKAASVDPTPSALESNRRDSARRLNAARRVTCSDYWAREKACRRPVAPNVACGCPRCAGRRLWPANHYVASLTITVEQVRGRVETWSVPISYECLQEQRRESADQGLSDIIAELRDEPERYGAVIIDRHREY